MHPVEEEFEKIVTEFQIQKTRGEERNSQHSDVVYDGTFRKTQKNTKDFFDRGVVLFKLTNFTLIQQLIQLVLNLLQSRFQFDFDNFCLFDRLL